MTLAPGSRLLPALYSCGAVAEGMRRAAEAATEWAAANHDDPGAGGGVLGDRMLPSMIGAATAQEALHDGAGRCVLDDYVVFVEPAPSHCLPSNGGASPGLWPPPIVASDGCGGFTSPSEAGGAAASAAAVSAAPPPDRARRAKAALPWARRPATAGAAAGAAAGASGGRGWRASVHDVGIRPGDVLCVCRASEVAAVGAHFERYAARNAAAAARLVAHEFGAAAAASPPAAGSAPLLPGSPLPRSPWAQRRFGDLNMVRLEALVERAGMQPYRLRHSFRKDCAGQLQATLRFVLQGRHLDFICDMCGTTNFKGPRLKCRACDNFDLCYKCHHSADPPTHRYLFRDGKWHLERNYSSHTFEHGTDLVLPPFHVHERWLAGQASSAGSPRRLIGGEHASLPQHSSPHFD